MTIIADAPATGRRTIRAPRGGEVTPRRRASAMEL
jgi:hypothetical protein